MIARRCRDRVSAARARRMTVRPGESRTSSSHLRKLSAASRNSFDDLIKPFSACPILGLDCVDTAR